MSKKIQCKCCKKEIAFKVKTCPECGAKNKKNFYKRFWFWLIVFIIIVAINGGEPYTTTTENSNNTNINLDNLNSYENVKLAYEQNLEKITNKEQLRELDIMNITKNDVLDYAKKASELCSKIEKSSDEINTIDKLVTLNDLPNNTTEDTMNEVLKYIVAEYESNKLQDSNKVLEYQYILRYLDKRLDNHTNMKVADELVFDMYQITKDTVRLNDENLDNNIKDSLKISIDTNYQQIDKNINAVKIMLT